MPDLIQAQGKQNIPQRYKDMGDGTFALVVSTAGAGGGSSGDASAANQVLGNASLANIDTDLGAVDSTAAAADGTGNYGVIAGVKRALLNWAALLARVPTLGAKTAASSFPVTLAADGAGVSALSSIAGMAVPAHDHITLGYTSTNVTSVVYRTGGAGGTIVATLTLAYTGSALTTITRS